MGVPQDFLQTTTAQVARAQGKRLGRPMVITDPLRLRHLLAQGTSYRATARILGVSEGAVRRAVRQDPTLRLAPP